MGGRASGPSFSSSVLRPDVQIYRTLCVYSIIYIFYYSYWVISLGIAPVLVGLDAPFSSHLLLDAVRSLPWPWTSKFRYQISSRWDDSNYYITFKYWRSLWTRCTRLQKVSQTFAFRPFSCPRPLRAAPRCKLLSDEGIKFHIIWSFDFVEPAVR